MEGFLNLIFGYFGGVYFPLHKPYPYSLYRYIGTSILGTNDMFGDQWNPFRSSCLDTSADYNLLGGSSQPHLEATKRPFGRDPRGLKLSMVINHLLYYWDDPPSINFPDIFHVDIQRVWACLFNQAFNHQMCVLGGPK